MSAALFLDQIRLAESMYGNEALARAIDAMPPKSRDEVRDLLPISWCTVNTAREFYYSLAAELNEDVNVFHRRLVGLGFEKTFTTLWRLLMRICTVEALVKRAAAIFGQSYDTGTVTAAVVESGLVEAHIIGWPGVPEFELEAIATGMGVMMRLTGRSNADVTWKRELDGARFDVRYS